MLLRIRGAMTFANVCSFLALSVALGTGTAYAANTVFSTDIVNGEVKTVDIHAQAVKAGKIGTNAVTSAEVANNSLTTADLLGASVTGHVSLSGIANGRCAQVTFGIGGAQVGEVPLVATGAAIQNGIFMYANRVSSAGHVEVTVCNMSGGAMTPISNFPVRVITFG